MQMLATQISIEESNIYRRLLTRKEVHWFPECAKAMSEKGTRQGSGLRDTKGIFFPHTVSLLLHIPV